MTRVADTSFLITLLDKKDTRRADALRWASDPEPILIPTEVLGEALGVLHRRAGYGTASAAWRAIIQLDNVELLETTEVELIADVFAREGGKLSWVDASVVVACETRAATALCFDEDILRALRR